MSATAAQTIRMCQEGGCGEPAYGPRAKRCLEHHRLAKRATWERRNNDPRVKAIRRSYWAMRRQEQRERVLPILRHVYRQIGRMLDDPTLIDGIEVRRLGAVLIQVYVKRRPLRRSAAGRALASMEKGVE